MNIQNRETLQVIPTKNQISIFSESADIETASDGYAGRFSGSVGNYFLSIQADITLDLLKGNSIDTVLDVGGGHAQIAVPLVNNGYKVTVTGSADVCCHKLDNLLPPNSFEYLTCDMLNLPFDDNHFEAVLAFRLLPHVNQWRKLISEMCRVSRNLVIFDYPDIRSFNFLYQYLFGAKKALEGNTRAYSLFNRREIIEEMKKHSFSNPTLKPQFFVPMVIHRLLNSVVASKYTESIFQLTGFTYCFGSPVILRATRLSNI